MSLPSGPLWPPDTLWALPNTDPPKPPLDPSEPPQPAQVTTARRSRDLGFPRPGGFPFFGKFLIVSWILAGISLQVLLIGREGGTARRRTDRDNPRRSRKPESGRKRTNWDGRARIGKPPAFEPPPPSTDPDYREVCSGWGGAFRTLSSKSILSTLVKDGTLTAETSQSRLWSEWPKPSCLLKKTSRRKLTQGIDLRDNLSFHMQVADRFRIPCLQRPKGPRQRWLKADISNSDLERNNKTTKAMRTNCTINVLFRMFGKYFLHCINAAMQLWRLMLWHLLQCNFCRQSCEQQDAYRHIRSWGVSPFNMWPACVCSSYVIYSSLPLTSPELSKGTGWPHIGLLKESGFKSLSRLTSLSVYLRGQSRNCSGWCTSGSVGQFAVWLIPPLATDASIAMRNRNAVLLTCWPKLQIKCLQQAENVGVKRLRGESATRPQCDPFDRCQKRYKGAQLIPSLNAVVPRLQDSTLLATAALFLGVDMQPSESHPTPEIFWGSGLQQGACAANNVNHVVWPWMPHPQRRNLTGTIIGKKHTRAHGGHGTWARLPRT